MIKYLGSELKIDKSNHNYRDIMYVLTLVADYLRDDDFDGALNLICKTKNPSEKFEVGGFWSDIRKQVIRLMVEVGGLELTKINEVYPHMFDGALVEEVVIPSNIKVIGKYAFIMTSLNKLTINEGVRIISDRAFSDCFNLSGEIKIPQSVEKLGLNIFSSDRGISTIYIPKHIDANSFSLTFQPPQPELNDEKIKYYLGLEGVNCRDVKIIRY